MVVADRREAAKLFARAVNKAFGVKLRRSRREREVSQAELASRVGSSRVTIATIEAGNQNTQLQHLFIFAKALDIPIYELIPSATEVENQQSSVHNRRGGRQSKSEILEEARALLLQIRKLSDEQHPPDAT
jgi:transcriptional regulator with XRE-family HTH domain